MMLSALAGISAEGLFTLEGNGNISPCSAFLDSWLMAHQWPMSRAAQEKKSLRVEVALCCLVELWFGEVPGDDLTLLGGGWLTHQSSYQISPQISCRKLQLAWEPWSVRSEEQPHLFQLLYL